MGHVRQGCLCQGSSQGAQTRVRVEASGVLTRSSTSSSHEQGKASGPTEGSGLPTEERSHREGQGLSQGLLLKPVPGEQERWGTQAGYQFERPESIHQKEDFPNGIFEGRLTDSAQGRLGGDDRLEGRLSARPYRVRTSTVPSFLVERKQVPVQTSSFWSQLSATDLHTSYLAVGDSVQGKRSQSNRLLGRFSSLRSQQGRTHSSHSVRLGHSEESRIPEKSQEMSSGTQTIVRVPRSAMELEGVTSFPASGKTGRFQAARTHPSIKSFSGSCSEIPRQGRLCSTGSTAREVTTATPSDGGDTGLEIRRADSGQRIQAFNQMVDTPSDRRDVPEVLHSAAVNDYRCFQFRVGSDSGRQVGQRQMVYGGEGPPHQPFGIVGGVQGSQELQTSSEEQESDGPFGQHHCYSPPFQGRRNTFGAFKQVDDGDLVVLQKPWSGSDSCLSPRDCESRSGRPIPREGDQRMVHQSDSDETDVQTVRSSTDRSLRFKQISSSGDLLFTRQKRQALRWDERSEPDLGVQPDVCFPASTDHPFDTGQDERVQGDIDSSHPLLVQGSLVTRTPADVSSGASTPSSASEYGERPDHRQEPAIFAEAQADSMAYLRNTFQGQGTDHTLAEFICGSWRDSTKNQYTCAWRTWSEWCGGHALSRTTPTVGQFVNYLWFLFNEKSLAWSTIRLHRAAIAMIVDPLTKTPLSQHPMISRFMKAVYLARPPARKVKPIWSVSSVLVMLRTWGNPEDLTRAKLTWRLAMLLALASARRASDLSLLDIDDKNLLKSDDSWRFSLVFGAKQDRPGHLPQDIVISKQVSRELCPIENLKEYLRRTEGEREGNTQLLRTTVPPLRPASKQTVRSWLTKVLDLAGIQAPGGSTRAASATWAAARAVPISTIMAAADWSCIKTMSRYYIRPLPQGAPVSEHMSVQRAVLGDV